MEVRACDRERILQPCELEGHAHQVDPYIGCEHLCRYCYALNQAETDWAREIRIHRDIESGLDGELLGLEPQSFYVGWNTDPYQPSEAVHGQTRRVLEVLARRGHSACILTKSGLVTRDIDLLARMPGSKVGVSVAFSDEDTRRLFEVSAPPTDERIEALEVLKGAGITTYALICPVMPFITDVGELVGRLAGRADAVWVYALHMESEDSRNWQNVRDTLGSHFPDLTERYAKLAFSEDSDYWAELCGELKVLRSKTGLDLKIKIRET